MIIIIKKTFWLYMAKADNDVKSAAENGEDNYECETQFQRKA